jgi:hypothetical protein
MRDIACSIRAEVKDIFLPRPEGEIFPCLPAPVRETNFSTGVCKAQMGADSKSSGHLFDQGMPAVVDLQGDGGTGNHQVVAIEGLGRAADLARLARPSRVANGEPVIADVPRMPFS